MRMRSIPRLIALFFGVLALAIVLTGCSRADATTVDRPAAEYDSATGRLRRLTFDANKNGRNNAVGMMDGARIERIEVDTDENGTADYWEFYDRGGVLTRVEEDTNRDGRVDKWETYRALANPSAGDPPSIVSSVAFDDAHRGAPTRILVFADDGAVERVETDPDGDGVFTAPQLGTGGR
jgi:hypothetical protein